MENKPAIIVSGNKNNMQPWYEEKCKRALEELAHLADTIRRPGDARTTDGKANRRKWNITWPLPSRACSSSPSYPADIKAISSVKILT